MIPLVPFTGVPMGLTPFYWRWLFPLLHRSGRAWFTDPLASRNAARGVCLRANLVLVLCGATLSSWPALSTQAWLGLLGGKPARRRCLCVEMPIRAGRGLGIGRGERARGRHVPLAAKPCGCQ